MAPSHILYFDTSTKRGVEKENGEYKMSKSYHYCTDRTQALNTTTHSRTRKKERSGSFISSGCVGNNRRVPELKPHECLLAHTSVHFKLFIEEMKGERASLCRYLPFFLKQSSSVSGGTSCTSQKGCPSLGAGSIIIVLPSRLQQVHWNARQSG